MAQQTDVVIDGAGYMIAPGKCTRGQDGATEGRVGRISFTDFFGGSRRHIQLERDRAFDTLRAGPAMNGQGVRPWGFKATATLVTDVLPSETVRIPTAIVRDRLYFALRSKVFESGYSGGGWTVPAIKFDVVKDMCLYSSNGVLITYGSAARDVTWWRVSDGNSSVLLADERGHWITNYGGYAIWNDARSGGRPTFLRQVTGTQIDLRILDYDVTRMVSAGAKCYAVTKSAVYSYTGRVSQQTKRNPAYSGPGDTDPETIPILEWGGDWSPYFQNGVAAEPDDFKLFEGFGGRIYAWVAGEVMEDNPNGDRAGWRSTGLTGRRCYGGSVAGGYLVVAMESWEGMNQLWAWDGSGWLKIDEKPSAATGNWIWPTNVNNSGSYDLIVFQHGVKTVDLYRLQDRSDSVHAFATSGSTFTTPMIDAGERDKTKAWRKIGAVFAAPERLGTLSSADAVQVQMEYSIDGGATWVTASLVTKTGNSLASMNFTMDADVASASSRFLMMRVKWSSVLNWAPVLVGMWCEFEVLDSPARRRRWNLDVIAQDQVVDRDSSTLTRTGRQLVSELWAAWQAGSVVSLRDLDYDSAPVQRSVRIVGISESVKKPSDQGRWGDSVVSLALVEM